MKILVINGPNLNRLGERETKLYGAMSLESIKEQTDLTAEEWGVHLEWFQSNGEGVIIDRIHHFLDHKDSYIGMIINPGGYSHTSVAILDALKMVDLPLVEVHLSQIFQRESYRKRLLTGEAATIIMSGVGDDAYCLALMAIVRLYQKRNLHVSNN